MMSHHNHGHQDCNKVSYLCQLFWVDRVASAIIGPIFAVSLKGKNIVSELNKTPIRDNDNDNEDEYDYGYYQ